ncbi:hypothetical protein Poli38472_011029 [Pythium oligandrum]|uniref:Uncharacterized protein n=2 Tax=Pythium oligandrum TaxID=41045 RepID=A0A8K1FNK0_PYTOL|nr:hypothetical protein Poli38472_011029 [Pythium oligandrum]|eukprot:TMW67409.1 hypothetical protein Poli38472_011029 [Pythium oligandrum]
MNADEMDAFLSELTRLQHAHDEASSAMEASEAFRQFAVSAPSSFAPESVQIVAQDGANATPAFVLPALPTSHADPARVLKELGARVHPSCVLRHPALGAAVLSTPKELHASRFLAQVPMAPSRMELVPTREHMVLQPLNLGYDFRPVSHSSVAPVMEGFSEAMKKQDEYAKQNIGKQPFAPGGNALTDQDGHAVVAHVASSLSEEEIQQNAFVLTEAVDALEDDVLAQLTATAPGLDGCLTLEDVKRAAKQETVGVEAAKQPLETVGVNPSTLLQPYFDVVADADTMRAMQRAIADEKASAAMQTTSANDANGVVALDELLKDMEDDDELAELGFNMNEDEEEGEEEKDDEDEEGGETAIPAPDATGEVSESLEPEAEVELLLQESTRGDNLLKKRGSSKQPRSEWASMERVDVRNFHAKVPDMAMKYDFELDTFQKECVIHLERHECVFVAAHTSAGKTVVAEYAIAMSQKHMTRTIYTSPIKALSNQKYRDFRSKYGPDNVGLITGDVSLNPDASCLVMTTEILRSMLYRGADVIRDIEWVIFDEIHYINDSERGVVWEEVIIMLPEHIGMVFLSATTPNHLEFSDWIGRTKKKKIHVISTYKRPVPLSHFLYAGKELFKLYDATSGYQANAYSAAKTKLFPPSDKVAKGSATGRAGGGGSNTRTAGGGRSSGGDTSDWTKLIYMLKEKTLLPVVVFAFSKRLCEESASKLAKLDLCTPSERSEIHLFLEASIQRLQGSDRELPQVLTMKEMLKRGIGVHHGGLLPIIKEMVEILFGRGLVKVLFSTETFAMGVNMPARTVVFNGIRKHDGKNFRDLLPGEYTQMAGRAGRRGLDTVGTVIIACWNDIPEPTSLQTMLAGKATSLSSRFRLTYNMILNLLRVEVLTVEDMMKRSFSEFHTQKALSSKRVPQLIQRGRKLLQTLERALREEYPHLEQSGELQQIQAFNDLKKQKRTLEKRLVSWMLTNHAQAARQALAPGRLVVMNVKGLPSDQFAVILRTSVNEDTAPQSTRSAFAMELTSNNATTGQGARAQRLFKTITVICLCPEDYEPPQKAANDGPMNVNDRMAAAFGGGKLLKSKRDEEDDMMVGRRLGRGGKKGSSNAVDASQEELVSNVKGTLLGKHYAVLDIPETCIDVVTSIQASSLNVKQLVATSSTKELGRAVEFLTQTESSTDKTSDLAFVDVLNELKLNDLEVATAYTSWQQLYSSILSHPCAQNASSLTRVLGKVERICKLQDYLSRLTRELSNDSLSLFPDFQQRLRVLKKLGYISEDGVVQVKGRVACEINTCEEVVLTEMIFENVLANLEPEEIVAVLSALIFQEKTQNEPTLTPRLEQARETVKRIAESLGVIQLQEHLDIDPAVYCKNSLNFGLMEVVYEWARGMSFKELCQLTDIQEGSIVRCITRLDEVCREVRNAARVIGDPSLYRKMEVASEAIKRDVVFASSLYLS